jgi:hypothetical protein
MWRNHLKMRASLFAFILFGLPLAVMSQTNNPSTKSPAEMMREMRIKILTTQPSQMGLKPSKDYPRVFLALMDWPLGTNVISVYGSCTGDSSIYTTATFGVMGGIGHEPVRRASYEFVRVAETHCDDAISTEDFPYPKPGRIYFYLVCYDGVRKIELDEESLKNGSSKYSDLGAAAQKLITELRQIVQRSD